MGRAARAARASLPGRLGSEHLRPDLARSPRDRSAARGTPWHAVARLDLDGQVLHVHQTIGAVHGHIVVNPPKTWSSARTVALPSAIVAVLRAHRQRQDERRAQLGEAWQDHDLVFTIVNGKPIHPDSLQHDFRRLVRLAGVPYIRIHDLRHTYVTLAYRYGASIKAISETVGHAGIGITLEVYAHVLEEQRREIADTLGAALFSSQGDATPGFAERIAKDSRSRS